MKVEKGHTVSVHYKGTLLDGTEFDNSRVRGNALNFVVGAGMMIPGFDAATVGMSVGDTKTVTSSIHSRPKVFEVLVARLANDFD